MLLTKFAVVAVLLASTVLAAPEAPLKLRMRMKGVKRDASHIANYYLPAATGSSYQHQHQHQYGGSSGAGGIGGGHGAQHLQVLDVKLPQHNGHYIPHYAIPQKSYESNAHHFPSHTPQFTHNGPQYVIKSSHGGGFDELSQVLGSHGSSASGHVNFGGASSSGHGIAAQASPSYSYSSQSFGNHASGLSGHQSAGFASQQSAGHSSQGGYSFASIPQTSAPGASKAGPLSFGEASQSSGHQQQQQQQLQTSAFGGHQFGFIAGGHGQQQAQAPQITYIPQAQALTSSHGHGLQQAQAPQIQYLPQAQALTSSHGQTQTTPVYAIGMKGLGHYATGSYAGHGSASSSASLGHGLSLGQHSFGGLSYGNGGGAHGGQYILDTSALQGLNLGGKFVVMSKPTGLTYGQSYSHQSPKYTIPTASYSSASLSSAGGYKSAAPFKPSVFLGATQENIAEYQHGNYAEEAATAGAYSAGGYSSGQEYEYASPTAASSSYGSSSGSSGGH